MKRINLNDLNKYMEDFLMMKMDVEAATPDEPRQTLNDFIKTLNVGATIFVDNRTIIPFVILHGKEDDYIVYCLASMSSPSFGSEPTDEMKAALDNLSTKLDAIGYDMKNLTKKTLLDMSTMYEDLMSNGVYFIMGNEFYV